jgi:hypothetical protein
MTHARPSEPAAIGRAKEVAAPNPALAPSFILGPTARCPWKCPRPASAGELITPPPAILKQRSTTYTTRIPGALKGQRGRAGQSIESATPPALAGSGGLWTGLPVAMKQSMHLTPAPQAADPSPGPRRKGARFSAAAGVFGPRPGGHPRGGVRATRLTPME